MRPRILYCLSAALVLLGILGCYSPGGSGVSGQASLAPGITAQPQSQTVALNGTATFQVTSTGLPLPSYQWERSNDGGATWSPVPGATGTSYALANAAIADNQAQFHVVLSDPAGSVASTAATLTVSASTGASQVVASLPPGSVPTGITTGPDGNLWFTNSGAGQIGKLDSLTHQVALINLPDPTCKPVGITTGPDGNLWFTEQAGGKLGVMTTAGALNNEFPVGSGPTGIITGSDGNLWVTLLTGNQIAKVNVAGVVSLFSLPTAGASPSGITLSPDGSIWFTETAVAQIGEISPAGAILEWSVQTPAGGVTPVPMGITSTPDGAIWYSDGANNCIGKFVPSNPVPLVRLPGSLSPLDTPPAGLLITIFFPLAGGANPNGLTTDVQGQVWVTEQGLNEVAVVTLTTQPGTTPGSYPLPLTGGLPVSLVLGPDGNIWVTLPGTNDVVMVVDLAPTNQVSVLVLPVSATVVGNGTQNFSAIVTGTPTPTVTWSVLEPGGGSITPDTGIYAAPSMAGTYHVVATSNAVTPPVAGEAAVTVTVPTISAITPPNPTVQGGGVVLFSAQVSGLGDDSIVWSASDGVMIPTTGVWTAPYTAETVTITATSNVDAALTATTQVLIPPSGTAVPIITTPPASLTVSAGSTATFTVVATGATTLIYQWQVSINGGSTWSNVGTGAASYTTPGTTAAFDGYLYQVVVGNGAGASVTSGAARLTVTYAPVITTQPLSQGVIPGSKATFLVAANGEPAPTFAWQLSQDGGNTWAAVTTGTGGGSPIYTTAATLETDNGNQYRVIVSNGIGSPVTSNVATLTLAAIPFGITTTPANQTVVVGNPATFTVSAYGPALTYQWQVSTDGGNTWSPVGTPSATLSLGNTTPVQNGYLYQVTVTDGLGASATAEALLTVTVPAPATPTITLSAVQAAPLAPNLTASVGAQPDASYAWTVTNGGIVSGQGTTGITFSAGSSGTVTVSCVVTNADSVPGSPGSATVTIVPVPTATVTMSAATYTANNPGYPGTASVPAQSNCTFLWTPVNGTITYGQGTNSITFTAGTVGIVTMQCTVTSAISGPATGYASSNVVAEVDDPAVTVSTPSMTQGQPYTAFVTPVSGAGYSWSLSTGTIQSGQNTSSITFTAGAPGGLTVICTITNAAGTSGLPGSNATATIYAAPTAALAASANNMLPAGGTVTLTPTFTGGTATVGTTGTGSSDVPGPFTSGSGFTSPTETVTTTFTLTVTNPAGTQATANQTINVAAATPSVTSLTASDWRVAAGQSATFTAAVQGYPGVNVAWWVSPDNGTTWYSITSSPWQFNSNGTVLAGFLPGTMGGNVCVAGTPSSGVATLGVYNLTTTLTLSNLPQTATLLVEVTASFGVTLPTSAPFTPPSTGLTGSASVNLVVEPATFSSTLLAAGDDHLLLLEPGQNNNGGGAPINYANYIWSCGRNDLGQLGNFTQTDSYPFQFVQYYYGYYQAEVPSIVLADAAGQHSVALDTQGNVYWWGNNTTGQIGAYPSLQAQTVSNVPSMVQYLVDNATSTFSLQADHTIWSWNAGGTPTQVTNFTGSYFLIATADADSNGTPYLAALDTSGNLWEGTASGYPGQLDTPTTLVGIFARGDSSLMGLDVGGNVWTWTVPASSETAPTQIPFAASPAGPAIVPAVKAVALAKGPGFLLAQDSQGGLWVYGTTNNNGQLGVTPGTLTNTGGQPGQRHRRGKGVRGR
jgi:streptogramin lyase